MVLLVMVTQSNREITEGEEEMRDKLYEAIVLLFEISDCSYEEARKSTNRALHHLYEKVEK
jgi:hypothetical protein